MSAKIKITGKPLQVRRVEVDKKLLICLEFMEGGVSAPPKGLPKGSKLSTSVLLTQKQWNKLNYKDGMRLLIEGELVTHLPKKIFKAELTAVCYQIKEIPNQAQA